MRKRRNIPTLPIDFFSDIDNKVNYQKILYSSILDGVEQTLKNGKLSFVMARVDDGKNLKDVSILKESFKTNLETVLDFYEQTEEYELCSKTLNLINQIK
jgi:ferric iron reductase protein FhuF